MVAKTSQLLKIEEPMNNNSTVITKKSEQEVSSEECSTPSRNKNVFGRVLKNFKQVFPQKWNKKKVKCPSV